MFDYHMHTRFSDGNNSHEEMVKEAIRKGITEIGFTDHFCLSPNDWSMDSIGELKQMMDAISKVKGKYAGEISILYGIEVDYFPGKENEIKQVLNEFSFDYVIGSVHFVEGDGFDSDPKHPIYDKYSADQLYDLYFETLFKASESQLFDIVAHPDLIKKFQLWPTKDQTDNYTKVAKSFAKNRILVELNTSGPDRPCKEFFPNESFLKILVNENNTFTIGSDSHKIQHIARNFEEGILYLQSNGVTELNRIEDGVNIPVPLNEFFTDKIIEN